MQLTIFDVLEIKDPLICCDNPTNNVQNYYGYADIPLCKKCSYIKRFTGHHGYEPTREQISDYIGW